MKPALKVGLVAAPLLAVALAVFTLSWMPGSQSAPALSGLRWPAVPAANAEPAKLDKSKLVELEVRDVIPIEEANTHAVVLVSKDKQIMLPIFVTEEAAVSIAFRLAQRASPHPLAADLLDDVVKQMGGAVTEVRISDVKDDIYTSQVVIHQGDKDLSLDARPSDAIAMALTGKARIFCAPNVLSQAGITRKEVDQMREHLGVGGGGADPGLPEDDAEPMDPQPGKAVPQLPEDHNISL